MAKSKRPSEISSSRRKSGSRESKPPPPRPRRKGALAKKKGGVRPAKSIRPKGQRPIRFQTYIKKIVKAQAGGRGMSTLALDELDNEIKGLLRLVVPTAVICSKHGGRKTLMSKDVSTAIDVLLRGDFADDVKQGINRVYQGKPAIDTK